jgi:putative intracellular protease/amidase
MKKSIIIVAILAGMMVWAANIQAESKAKILLIPREGRSGDIELMLTKEVGVMVAMLEKGGLKVEVATASGTPLVSNDATLKPDLKLSDVKVADYVGFIVACMAVGIFPTPPQPPEAVAIVKQAATQGKPVAAQCGGVQILAEAGILKGKRYAFCEDPLSPQFGPNKDTRFAGATYCGIDVVQDGNIITSGICPYGGRGMGIPDGTAKLTQSLIAEFKKRENR